MGKRGFKISEGLSIYFCVMYCLSSYVTAQLTYYTIGFRRLLHALEMKIK